MDSIEFDKKKVVCKDNYLIGHNYSIDYDYLVLAPGCDSNTFNVPGVLDNPQVFFLIQLRHARQVFLIQLRHAEFAAELYDFIQKDAVHYYPDLVSFVSVTIVETSHHLLGSFNSAIVSYVEKKIKKRKINVVVDRSVKKKLEITWQYYQMGPLC